MVGILSFVRDYLEKLRPKTVPKDPCRYLDVMRAFDEQDRKNPPPIDPVVFSGGSIVRLWSHLESQMAPIPVLNRGFGGATSRDLLYHLNRAVEHYDPKLVVVYIGSNDTLVGDKAEYISRRLRLISERILSRRSNRQMIYLSLIRSSQRPDLWASVDSVNRLLEELCECEERLNFFNLNRLICDSGGIPRRESFLDDGWHLKPETYEIISKNLKLMIQECLK